MNRIARVVVVIAASLAALVALSASATQLYYCKYCGHKTTSVNSLTASLCQRHPDGPAKDRHALYEGGEKER